MVDVNNLKQEMKRILEEGNVKYIIGYERSTNSQIARPAFFKNSSDIDRMIWDPTCIHNLTRFLLDEKKKKSKEKESDHRPVGLMVKGCDSRAVVVLLQEKYLNRDDIYLLGVSCENSGMIDEKKLIRETNNKEINEIEFTDNNKFIVHSGKEKIKISAEKILADRCLECRNNFPVIYDVFFGEKIKRNLSNPFESLEKIENLSPEKRWHFWKEKFDACIRCYACRSVCPMCYCDECVVDTINYAVTADTGAEEKADKIKWIERSTSSSENIFYHLIRAIHLAGRCIDCGECERVCPVDIPLRHLNKKLEKEAKVLFDYEAGLDPEIPSLISNFKDDDPEDFIR